MPFERPSMQVLLSRIQSDIEGRLTGADARLRRHLLYVLAKMETGVAHGLYGSLDWLSKNLLPTTTSETILAQWAEIYGVPQLGATPAIGSVLFTGNNAAVVPAGTLLKGTAGQYSVNADITIEDGEGIGQITALDTGIDTNLSAGASLTLVAPVSGINNTATVQTQGLVGGADIELVTAWQARLLQRIQQPPIGGARHDYERWAREAHPAVTHAWVTAHEGGNQGVVAVRIATYDDPAGDLPDAESPLLGIVYDYIDARRPVAGGLDVFAPIPQVVNTTLAIQPDTAAVREAAEAALRELFRREARPGQFVDYQGNLLGTIPLTHVSEALSLVPGEHDHQIQLIDSLAPQAVGYMLVLGDITWAEWQE